MSDIELTAKQHNKIKRAVKALNDVRAEVQQENPDNDINWYLEDTANFNLMSGLTHDDQYNALPNNIIEVYDLHEASGGAW